MNIAARKIRVFVVDDSALVRSSLSLLLGKVPDIELIGAAANPRLALTKMKRDWPDVIISDLEMPEMDGITFLKYLNETHPTPFIVCSSHTGAGAKYSLDALSLGAVEIISKPSLGVEAYLEEIQQSILDAVRAAANASVEAVAIPPVAEMSITRQSVPVHMDMERAVAAIAIGSSTGGTTVIEQLLRKMKPGCPPLLIVQHMPMHFTQAFARRLNDCCAIEVKEAEDGEPVKPGTAYIAQGGKHMVVRQSARSLVVDILDTEPVNRHRPSVDMLFDSVAECLGKAAVGVILTGMGRDGAAGLMRMKQAGAFTIAQDEASCAVYGMPRVAIESGAADVAVSVTGMANCLSGLSRAD